MKQYVTFAIQNKISDLVRRFIGLVVVLILSQLLPMSASAGVVFSDDMESGGGNWTVTAGSGAASINSDTANSPFNSLRMGELAVTVESIAIDTTSSDTVTDITLALWVRRGSNFFNNYPETGEDFVLEYLNSFNSWVALETFTGGGTDGEIFNRTYSGLTAAEHSGFKVRFRTIGGSGNGYDYWHVDDVSVTVTTASGGSCSDTFADSFASASYSRNDGTANWAGNWQEVDDNNNAASGHVFITGGEVRLNDFPDSGGQPGLYRELDLSGYVSATLTYDYSTSGTLEGSDHLQVQVSGNGGSSWTQLVEYSGNVNGAASYDLTSYLAANTRIRFRISNNTGSGNEYYAVDNVVISAEPDSGCGSPTPVALWRMESGPWTGAAGEVEDLSGNGLHGRAINGAQSASASPARVGDPGTCDYAEFNGTNQYLEVADNNLLDIADNLTVSVWINPSALPGSGLMSILSKDENYEFHIKPNGEINWWWNDSGGTTREFDSVGANISPGNWYHVALTYESGEQVIYVNGVQRASASYSGNLRTNSDPLQIGQDQFYAGRHFSGDIDEVQIFNQTLSSTQVTDLYNETHPCSSVASACSASFPDALSSHSGGTIAFDFNDQVLNSPDNILDAGAVTSNGGLNTCSSANCTASGSSVTQLDPGAFPDTSGFSSDFSIGYQGTDTLGTDRNQYRNVTVDNEGVLTVSAGYSEYFIDTLTLQYRSTINLPPGDYWINSLSLGNEVVFNVTGSGTVRFFVNNNATISYHSRVNSPALNTTGDVSQFFLYGYGNLTLDRVTYSGVLYSQGNVTLTYLTPVFGAVTADNITMQGEADITYDATGIANMDFGDLCGGGSACTLGGFNISQPAFAIACSDTRAQVNIQAMCDDGITVFDAFTGTVNLTTSVNAFSSFYLASSGGSPVTSIYFDGSEHGEQDVYLYHTNESEDLRVTAEDQATGMSSTALVGTDVRTQGLQVSGAADFICGGSNQITLTAVGKDDQTGACAVITDFDGNKDFKAWFEVNVDPAGDPGADLSPTAMTIDGTAVSAQSVPAANNLSLAFNSGIATAAVAYPDSGEVLNVNFLHNDAPFDGSVAELDPLTGSTGRFVVQPAQVSMTVTTPGYSCVSGDLACSAFVPAGDSFDVHLEAVCSTGDIAPSYQGQITLAHELEAPAGGASGGLGVSSAQIGPGKGGELDVSQTFSEVGSVLLKATPEAYFAKDLPTFEVSNVGRFYPAYLSVSANIPAFEPPWSCSYTYQDQPFGFLTPPVLTVTGYNRAGNVTNNYDSAFFNFPEPAPDYFNNLAASQSPTLSYNSAARAVTVASGVVGDGARNITISGDLLTHDKVSMTPTAMDDPFDVDINILFDAGDMTDNDGACYQLNPLGACQAFTIPNVTGTEIRYGRLHLENAFGPETSDLVIPMQAEYWTGTTFTANTEDNCSRYATDAPWMGIQNYSDNLDAGETDAMVDSNTGVTETFTAGRYKYATKRELYLTAPGLGNEGSVEIAPTTNLWMRYDWDADGDLDDPLSTATFGQFRGHDRIIFWREIQD